MSFSDPFLAALATMSDEYLRGKRRELVELQLSGAQVVSHSFEGNGVTLVRTGDIADMVRQIQVVLDAKNGESCRAPLSSVVDFRSRLVGS